MSNGQPEGTVGGPELPPQGQNRSSAGDVWLGIAVYFLWGIVSGMLVGAAHWIVPRPLVIPFGGLVTVAYWGGLIAIWMAARRRGRPGIAKGLVMGFVIGISLVILLVASCFGLLLIDLWRNY